MKQTRKADMLNKTEQTASIHLGKKVQGSDKYDPSLLVAVERSENREQYNIKNDNLPFEGFDVWHAYEFSSMTKNGLPVTRLLKLNYSCNSEHIVESKSLKLYLNSFNMSRYGSSIDECLEICKGIIEKDLSKILHTDVTVNFLENSAEKIQIFSEYKNILDFVDESALEITEFKEAPDLLEIEQKHETQEYRLRFDSLRSNCRVTHQPDFGGAFIFYRSKKHIKEDSLIKYLCSFRSEFHFHEECCEMIFKRLFDLTDKDDKLLVCILYTRRGGIDICPVRYSKNFIPSETVDLIDITKYARSGINQ